MGKTAHLPRNSLAFMEFPHLNAQAVGSQSGRLPHLTIRLEGYAERACFVKQSLSQDPEQVGDLSDSPDVRLCEKGAYG
jgi:hypothetical protein